MCTSSCPVSRALGLVRLSGLILVWLGFFQTHPLGLPDLYYARILHHDLHDAIAQGFDLLGHKFQPFSIFASARRQFLLDLAH